MLYKDGPKRPPNVTDRTGTSTAGLMGGIREYDELRLWVTLIGIGAYKNNATADTILQVAYVQMYVRTK